MIHRSSIILGPPGCGKTTRLMDIVDKEIKDGVPPNRIAFCSFTKKAASEAIDRAADRFNYSKKDMVYFRTIHSMAFQACGMKKDQVLQHKDYKRIGEHLGVTFSSKYADDLADGVVTKHRGDHYRHFDAFARARHMKTEDVWHHFNTDDLNWYEFLRYLEVVQMYKSKYQLYDFADMLTMAKKALPVDVLIVDEAQDLSTAQWEYLAPTLATAKRVYIAGDDDQAIYQWSGADVSQFLKLDGDKTVLSQSYRVPRSIHTLASTITDKIHRRIPKEYSPKASNGRVDYFTSVDHIDMSTGTWLLLARNSYLLGELAETVKGQGWAYCVRDRSTISQTHVRAITQWEKWRKGAELSDNDFELIAEFLPQTCTKWPNVIWHEAFTRMRPEDREYYISLLRRGEPLVKSPRINISTIHGVKGGEADNVVLLSDVAVTTWKSGGHDPDSEHRVWYVGVTRAKESLNIVLPRGTYHYNL